MGVTSRLFVVLLLALAVLFMGGSVGYAQPGTPSAPASSGAAPNLLLWLSAGVAPEPGSAAERVFRAQLDEFEQTYGGQVAVRTKRAEGPGGVYETLRTAHQVAPSVVPDLILMRYSQLARAVGAKLVAPVDLQALNLLDLFSSGTPLGRVNDVQYGVPYLLEFHHLAYRLSRVANPPATLSDVLAGEWMFLFPARGARGVNSTVLWQYVSAGGRFTDDDNRPNLDRAPLLAVLGYYEQAYKATRALPAMLDYSGAGQYWVSFTAGRLADLIQVDSTMFLAGLTNGLALEGELGIAWAGLPLPGASVTPAPVLVDGWVWAVTSPDAAKRARSLELLSWLMSAPRQSAFSRALGVLPSRASALGAWQAAPLDSYLEFVSAHLNRPGAPLPEMLDPAVAAALQTAFENVFLGRKSPDAATYEAVATFTE